MIAVTNATFEEEVVNNDLPVLVKFWGDWCQNCHLYAPILDEIEKEYEGKLAMASVDCPLGEHENQKLMDFFHIAFVPTVILIKDKRLVGGMSKRVSRQELRHFLSQHGI